MFSSLSEYPRWFVALCTLLAGALALWILMKLAKLAVWALVFVLVVAGIALAAGFFLK